jgi:cytochrome P450
MGSGRSNCGLRAICSSQPVCAPSPPPKISVLQENRAESRKGAETTSTALAAVFFYLSRNPSVHEKLNREIRTAFPRDVPVALGPTLNSCVYLRAVLDESLRLCPSAGGAFWRLVLPGGLTVDGTQHIPADYEVSTGIYAIHHNAAYYPDPFEFRPERWLVGERTSREEVERAKSAFSAFLIGPRGCIGKGLAIAQVLVSVAAVVREFDFRVAEGEWGSVGEDEGEFKGQFRTTYVWTSEKDGPYIQFRRRE